MKKNSEVAKHCREAKKPILITKNGYVEKIILNTETYGERMTYGERISQIF
ncbi:MAG: hypothetical protein FWD19_00070 [Defluviitaleaceae bacterium]|nr:hypothetical protein [Defluviitaleaceae bacterium]